MHEGPNRGEKRKFRKIIRKKLKEGNKFTKNILEQPKNNKRKFKS